VQRGLYLGQVELGLMALVVWDLCQPGGRWWKGAATGLAAGIKIIPGLFILYLLVTRQFRQALVAAGAFVASVLIGFAVLPGPSVPFWLEGNFFVASRTGFVGSLQNQSLRGLLTRLAGTVDGGMLPWLLAAAIVIVIGLAAAVVLHNAGYAFAGLMVCGLVAQLASPISWDHHWVWLIPGLAVCADAAVRAGRGKARAAWYGLAGVVLVLIAAWPDFWHSSSGLLHGGLINYAPMASFASGDNPGYPEYHWGGLQLIAGNLYVLLGLALLALALACAARTARDRGGVARLLRGPGG
jgi:alpha-1,2-mannosyltransferase